MHPDGRLGWEYNFYPLNLTIKNSKNKEKIPLNEATTLTTDMDEMSDEISEEISTEEPTLNSNSELNEDDFEALNQQADLTHDEFEDQSEHISDQVEPQTSYRLDRQKKNDIKKLTPILQDMGTINAVLKAHLAITVKKQEYASCKQFYSHQLCDLAVTFINLDVFLCNT